MHVAKGEAAVGLDGDDRGGRCQLGHHRHLVGPKDRSHRVDHCADALDGQNRQQELPPVRQLQLDHLARTDADAEQTLAELVDVDRRLGPGHDARRINHQGLVRAGFSVLGESIEQVLVGPVAGRNHRIDPGLRERCLEELFGGHICNVVTALSVGDWPHWGSCQPGTGGLVRLALGVLSDRLSMIQR